MTAEQIVLESPRALLRDLRLLGFTIRTEDGQLLISPVSKLLPDQRAALKANKAALIALLEWEAEEGPATDADFKVWMESAENPLPKRVFTMTTEEKQ